MIKRLKSSRSHGTMVANPRRKKRNGSHKRKARKHSSLRALLANPRRKHKKHKAKRNPVSFKHYAKKRSHKRRNPDLSFAGLDVVSVGVGSVAAIALGSIGQAVFDKYLSSQIENKTLRALAPNAIVAGAAWAAGKYVKNPKVKSIAKVTLMLSIFKMVDDTVGQQIKDATKNILPSGTTSGRYLPALKGNMGGAYISNTGGAYMATHGIMPSANLYGL